MNENSIPWADLQVVLAIARGGSLAVAARTMNVSHATMFRRLNDIEQRLGTRLFDRSRTGYTPTGAGEDLAATASRVEDEILGAERRLLARDKAVSGVVRLTTTDTLLAGLVSPLLTAFLHEQPEVALEVVVSNQLLNLTRRDADVAIRPAAAPPENLIGRNIGVIQQAVYGKRDLYAGRSGVPEATDSWVGPDANMGYPALERWMRATGADEKCRYRVDSTQGMLQGVRDGMGVAVLPSYIADADPELVRLTPSVPELAIDLWMLTHPDLRHVGRIRALFDLIVPKLRAALPAAYET